MSKLSQKQISFVKTAIYATQGNLEQLKISFEEALNNGMTVNEAKEAMLHLYAYAGFPRSINATNTLRELIDHRKTLGIDDPEGVVSIDLPPNVNKNKLGEDTRTSLTGPRDTPAYAKFSPTLDIFLKEHLFADLFSRKTLTKLERELITISILAALGNVEGQFKTHIDIAQRVGLTDEQLQEFHLLVQDILKN